MSQSKFQKLAVFIIIAGFIIYICFLLFSSDFGKFKLKVAEKVTVSDSISTTGYIFRNEQKVYNSGTGVISYELSDGEAVNKDGTIANIYANEEQAVAHRRAEELESEIESLSSMNHREDAIGIDLDTLNSSIESKIIDLLSELNDHAFTDIDETKSSLTSSVNQRQYVVGEENNYEARIEQMKSELSELKSGISTLGTVTAEAPGFFVSRCDGYESPESYNNIMNITAKDLDALAPTQTASNCVGKLITDFKWYIVAKVTADEALILSDGSSSLTVNMPVAVSGAIPVTVEAVNQENKQSDGVVILSCNVMSEELTQIRKEPIQINLRTVTGIYVPKQAIHDESVEVKDENGNIQTPTVQGVYVLTGQKIDFKEILILYSGNDYVICAAEPDKERLITGSSILLHDQIIVEGDDIYDGKIVE